MKKNDDRGQRERRIMVLSSALVLGALTLSGIYAGNQAKKSLDKGYSIDFSALENRAEEKRREIAEQNAKNNLMEGEALGGMGTMLEADKSADNLTKSPAESNGDSMSYGAESASGTKAIPEWESKENTAKGSLTKAQNGEKGALTAEDKLHELEEITEKIQDAIGVNGESPVETADLHFQAQQMVRPTTGEVLMEYSPDAGIYFKTLDQYRHNPAVIYRATLGEQVLACNRGRVVSISKDPEYGHMLVLDLGDGYRAIYGQLEEIEVPIGGTVEPGMKIASVGEPTGYYSLEGTNLYFRLMQNDQNVDPGQYF